MELIGSTGIMQKSAWNPFDVWHSMTGGDAWNSMWHGRADTMQQLAEKAKQEDNGGSASAMLGSINEYKNSPSSGIADAWRSFGVGDDAAALARIKRYADSGNAASKERYDSIMRWRNHSWDVGARLNMDDELGGSAPKDYATNKNLTKYMAPSGTPAETPTTPAVTENFKPPVAAPTPVNPVAPSPVKPATPRPAAPVNPAMSVAAPGQQLTQHQTAMNAELAQGLNPLTHLPMGFDPRDQPQGLVSTKPADVQQRMEASRAEWRPGGKYNSPIQKAAHAVEDTGASPEDMQRRHEAATGQLQEEAPVTSSPEDVARRMATAKKALDLVNPATQLKKSACVNLSFQLLGF